MREWSIWSMIGLGACCALALSSCETSPQTAFPTTQTITATGMAQSADLATLSAGRKLYTTNCTECHVARPVAQYSIGQWRHIVEIMAPRAGLTPSDRAALEAYLIAARKSVPQSWAGF
jgi:mono/diheme cytochrome c family protein